MNQDRVTTQLAVPVVAQKRAQVFLSVPSYPRPREVSHPWRDEPWRTAGRAERQFKNGFWTREAVQERRWAKKDGPILCKVTDK